LNTPHKAAARQPELTRSTHARIVIANRLLRELVEAEVEIAFRVGIADGALHVRSNLRELGAVRAAHAQAPDVASLALIDERQCLWSQCVGPVAAKPPERLWDGSAKHTARSLGRTQEQRTTHVHTTTPARLSESLAWPFTKPVVYSPGPTMRTFTTLADIRPALNYNNNAAERRLRVDEELDD
jgi:hypothetical protein